MNRDKRGPTIHPTALFAGMLLGALLWGGCTWIALTIWEWLA